jgi:hypothetical protein
MGRRDDENEVDLGDEDMDYADMQEDYDLDEGRRARQKNEDINNLKMADNHMPNTIREKNL